MSKFNFDELKEAIEINSFTKNRSGVNRAGEIFQREIEKLGFKTEIFERDEIGNHLLFKSGGESGDRVLLLGHLDTVFPEGVFEDFSEDDEWVYGAGVCDMKGGNYVALQSLRNLKDELGEIKNIDMLLVSDEESGSDDSKFVTKELSKNYKYSFVFEASGENGELVIARKGVGTLFLEIEGKPAHAGNSYTKGINANLEASMKLIELTKLTNLELGTTVNVGKIEGGIGANTISPSAKLTFEIRYTMSEERDRVLREVNRIVETSFVEGTVSKLSGGIQRDVMESSDEKMKLIKRFEEISGSKIPFEKRGGVSDANITSSMGVLTLDGFGPFGDGDHTPKERALKESFSSRVDLVTKILHYFSKEKSFNI
jgi:glutamate carboxypeptidase